MAKNKLITMKADDAERDRFMAACEHFDTTMSEVMRRALIRISKRFERETSGATPNE